MYHRLIQSLYYKENILLIGVNYRVPDYINYEIYDILVNPIHYIIKDDDQALIIAPNARRARLIDKLIIEHEKENIKPFLSQDLDELLKTAIKTKDCEHIELEITTNGTKFIKEKLVELYG